MTLTPGTRLGPYEILAPIGAGGMGEVYKAKDTRLDRFVAIKVLPEHLAKHPESLARFEREAKAVAALNHAHITALFDIGRERETVYAVMELLEGQTLRAKLEDGPLSPRLATELAIQMAQGLAAAHGKGVVHRDLKPANLWITSDGRLKILDFGLAKQLTLAGPGSGSFLPTEIAAAGPQTEKGMILGTMGYMSPEQVRGEAVDARSDLFSFGVVLFEMLTGKRAFGRDTAADTMAAILKEDPPALHEASNPPPIPLRKVVEHCLEKLPARRFQNAEDLAFALGNLSDASGATISHAAQPAPRVPIPGLVLRWAPWALVAILLLGVAGLMLRRPPSAPPAPVRQWDLIAGSLDSSPVGGIELSPDGRRIVYSLDRRLWVRELSEGQAREVVGSEQATGTTFWSQDGATLIFNARGKIWRSSLGSEPPLAICDVPGKDNIMGGAWLKGGDLLLSVRRGDLYRVPSTGGVPQVEVALDHSKEVDFHQFTVLPDGESVLTVLHGMAGQHQIELIRGKSRTVLLHDDQAEFMLSTYLRPGFLLMNRRENLWTQPALWAAPFSPEEGRLTGPAFLVAPEFGSFTSTRDGLMAFMPSRPNQLEPVWLDENGRVSAPAAPPLEEASDPALSPDGKRVAVAANTGRGRDIWMLDLAGRTWSAATETRADSALPRWSPDGKAVIFELRTGSSWFPDLAEVPADGSAPFRKIVQGVNPLVSPDGSSLVYARDQAGEMDIQQVPRAGGTPAPVLATPSIETPLGFSPDGNWLLYASNESGQRTAYVMRYPGGGEKQALAFGPMGSSMPMSGARGRLFRWTTDGRFYYWDGKSMRCVDVDTRQGLRFGPPRTLFQDPGQGVDFSRGFDVDPRTGRILVLRDVAGPSLDAHVIRIIENAGTLVAQRSGRS
jgi:Tol biopolymer transport system component